MQVLVDHSAEPVVSAYVRIYPDAKGDIAEDSRVPTELMALLRGKDVLVGAIDVASDRIETPEEVAATLREAMKYVPAEKIFPCTNCGMAPLDRGVALAKLTALAGGAALLRRELGAM